MGQQPSRPYHEEPSIPTTAAGGVATAGVAGDDSSRHDFFSFFPLFGFGFLTFNSIASVRRSIHDPWTVAFVAFSYADLLLLYYCFRLVERTAAGDVPRRQRLKAAVWLLASFLTAMFSYRVAAIMPPALAVLVWAMSAFTVAAGFYAMFLYEGTPEKEVAAAGKNLDAYEKC